MENFTIERQGLKNLDFMGELIGQSSGTAPRIKIYRTEGHNYIGQWNANQKYSGADTFKDSESLISYFRNNFTITPEVEDAIEDAAAHDDAFKSAWNERVS